MNVSINYFRSTVDAIFRSHGFTEPEAAVCADEIVESEARGHRSHGAAIVGDVVKWRQSASSGPWPGLVRIDDAPAHAFLDGRGGAGPYVAAQAMDLACEKATDAGVAVVGVRNPWAFVTAGYNVRRAARSGFLSMNFCGTASRAAPFGAADALLGTNPIGIAVPGDPDPVVLDIATTAIAGAEIRRASRLGHVLPPGTALDAEGQPTEDAAEAMLGSILAFGGHRGSGLAAVLELLCGAFLGAKTGLRMTGSRGMVFLSLRQDLFVDAGALYAAVAGLRADVAEARPSREGGALLPGERGDRAIDAAKTQGLEIDARIWVEVEALLEGPS